jgi:hypothetical protein
MITPDNDAEEFLANSRSAEGRDLWVAITYAELMVEALQAGVAEWAAVAATLKTIHRDHPAATCN